MADCIDWDDFICDIKLLNWCDLTSGLTGGIVHLSWYHNSSDEWYGWSTLIYIQIEKSLCIVLPHDA